MLSVHRTRHCPAQRAPTGRGIGISQTCPRQALQPAHRREPRRTGTAGSRASCWHDRLGWRTDDSRLKYRVQGGPLRKAPTRFPLSHCRDLPEPANPPIHPSALCQPCYGGRCRDLDHGSMFAGHSDSFPPQKELDLLTGLVRDVHQNIGP